MSQSPFEIVSESPYLLTLESSGGREMLRRIYDRLGPWPAIVAISALYWGLTLAAKPQGADCEIDWDGRSNSSTC